MEITKNKQRDVQLIYDRDITCNHSIALVLGMPLGHQKWRMKATSPKSYVPVQVIETDTMPAAVYM